MVCVGGQDSDNCSPTFGKIPIFDPQVDSSCFCKPIPHSFDNIPDFPLGTSFSLSHCDSRRMIYPHYLIKIVQ